MHLASPELANLQGVLTSLAYTVCNELGRCWYTCQGCPFELMPKCIWQTDTFMQIRPSSHGSLLAGLQSSSPIQSCYRALLQCLMRQPLPAFRHALQSVHGLMGGQPECMYHLEAVSVMNRCVPHIMMNSLLACRYPFRSCGSLGGGQRQPSLLLIWGFCKCAGLL